MPVFHVLRFAAAALLCTCALHAQAAITCNVSTSGFTTVYSETITTANDSQGSFTVSCTRGLTSDPTSFVYTLRANNGQNAGGGVNRAVNGSGAANRIDYELYINSTYATAWGNRGTTDFDGVVNFGTAATMFASDTKTFYARVFALQNVNAKTFTDSVTLNLRNSSGNSLDTSALAVTIINTPSCQFTMPPGSMVFNYSSFQTTAAAASTPYSVRCTNNTTFTPALDAAGGSLLTLNYTLALSNPGLTTANGLPQNYTINGSVAAGQSGTCATGSCTGTQARTLTLTY